MDIKHTRAIYKFLYTTERGFSHALMLKWANFSRSFILDITFFSFFFFWLISPKKWNSWASKWKKFCKKFFLRRIEIASQPEQEHLRDFSRIPRTLAKNCRGVKVSNIFPSALSVTQLFPLFQCSRRRGKWNEGWNGGEKRRKSVGEKS